VHARVLHVCFAQSPCSLDGFWLMLICCVGVVPNSLQDIGWASDEAKRRPIAGGLVSWRLDSLVSRRRRLVPNS
jgi:hypothetical protein